MKLAPPRPPRPASEAGPPGEGTPPGVAVGPGAGVCANVEAAKAPIPPAMMNSRRFNLHLTRGHCPLSGLPLCDNKNHNIARIGSSCVPGAALAAS